MLQRTWRVLPGLWAGVLLCIAVLAAPAACALLPAADAGKVVGYIFAREGWFSLLLAAVLLLGLRGASPSGGRGAGRGVLLWGTVVCTLLGGFAVQAAMPAARAGQGMLSFGQLHLVSTVFYGLKTVLVLVLAWRAAAP